MASADYDQYVRDIQEATDVSVNLSRAFAEEMQEHNRMSAELALQYVHKGHPIYNVMQSLSPQQRQEALNMSYTISSPSSATTSFIRELEAELGRSPDPTMPVADRAGSPVTPMPVSDIAGSSGGGVNVPVSKSK